KYVTRTTPSYSSIERTLDVILSPFNLTYKKVKGYYVILAKSEVSTFVETNMVDYAPITAIDPAPRATKSPDPIRKPISTRSITTRQHQEATGKVVSAKEGFPLPSVSVSVKGGTGSTVTDINGNYKINVPNTQATLVFSYVGYLSQEVPLAGVLRKTVHLEEDVRLL